MLSNAGVPESAEAVITICRCLSNHKLASGKCASLQLPLRRHVNSSIYCMVVGCNEAGAAILLNKRPYTQHAAGVVA